MMEEDSKTQRPRGGSVTMFPGRLHELLEYVESQNMDHIVSWCRNGTAFMVHRPDELLQLLSFFFGQTKYRSFTRQLNMWFFEREEHGPFKGAYHHPYFLQHNKDLCAKMSRNCPPDNRLYNRAIVEIPFKSTNEEICQKEYMLWSPHSLRLTPNTTTTIALGSLGTTSTSSPFCCDDSLLELPVFMSPDEPEPMSKMDSNRKKMAWQFRPAQADFKCWPDPFPLLVREDKASSTTFVDNTLCSISQALEPNPIQERSASVLNFAAVFNAESSVQPEGGEFLNKKKQNKQQQHEDDQQQHHQLVVGVGRGGGKFSSSSALTQDEDGLYLLRLLQGDYNPKLSV